VSLLCFKEFVGLTHRWAAMAAPEVTILKIGVLKFFASKLSKLDKH
jgi:hypothetical protein